MSREELEKRLAELREGFRGELPGRLDEITAAWRVLRESGWNEEDAKTLERLAHTLAGGAATFGLQTVSEAARTLELAVGALQGGGAPSDGDLARIASLMASLEASVREM